MAGSKARSTQYPCRHHHTVNVVFGDAGTSITMGYIPEYAFVVRAWAEVHTAFNSGTSDVLDIGYSGDADEYAAGASMNVATVGTKEDATTFNAAAVKRSTSGDLQLTCLYTSSGTAPTAGEMDVTVEYIVRNQAPDGVNS